MAATGWLTELDNALSVPLNNFITTGAIGLSQYLTGPLTAGVAIYIMASGIGILSGRVQAPLAELITFAVKLGVIILLVGNADTYHTFVTGVFLDTLPREIAGALHTGAPTTAATFDTLNARGLQVAAQVWETTSVWSPASMFVIGVAGIVVLVFVAIVAAVGFCVTLYAKTALALCLALGPLFIALALFDATKGMFSAWTAQLANYTLLQVLLQAVGSLILVTFQSLMATAVNTGSASDVLFVVPGMIAYAVTSIYLFKELPSLASALAGGGAQLAGAAAAGSAIASGAQAADARMLGGSGAAVHKAVSKALGLGGRR